MLPPDWILQSLFFTVYICVILITFCWCAFVVIGGRYPGIMYPWRKNVAHGLSFELELVIALGLEQMCIENLYHPLTQVVI